MPRRPRTNPIRPATPLIPAPGWIDFEPNIVERKRLGFSLGDMAAALPLDYSRLSLLERGRTPVPAGFVERYRQALERLKKARAARRAEDGAA